MAQELLYDRHVRYFKMVLTALPSRLQSEASNKLMIMYCAIGGLGILDYKFTQDEIKLYTEYVYSLLVPSGEGFRGSHIHELISSEYDRPTIANTYCALCILTMLGDDFHTRLDSELIMSYVSRCQLADGSIKSLLDSTGEPCGEGDLRQSYMAVSICQLLKYKGPNRIDLEKLESYIMSKRTFDGGLGEFESHAGYTFCGLATLKLMDRLELRNWTKTIQWLVHRQISFTNWNQDLLEYEDCDIDDVGSHNGRINKLGDTCYSFWCSASLAILEAQQFVNRDAMESYLLSKTQSTVIGGFGKTDQHTSSPDPYHSFLALSALSLMSEETKLQAVNPMLVVTQDAYDRLSNS